MSEILYIAFQAGVCNYILHTASNEITTVDESNNLRDFLLNFDYSADYEVRYIPQDKAKGSTYAYLTHRNMREIVEATGDAGLVLMTHYLNKVNTHKYDFFDDSKVGEVFGWSAQKTQRIRIALVKAGWVKKIVYTQPTTKAKFTVVYLGKEMCSKVLTPEEYTTQLKQKEAMDAKRDTIAKQLGYADWESVMTNEDHSKILEMFEAITLEGEAK